MTPAEGAQPGVITVIFSLPSSHGIQVFNSNLSVLAGAGGTQGVSIEMGGVASAGIIGQGASSIQLNNVGIETTGADSGNTGAFGLLLQDSASANYATGSINTSGMNATGVRIEGAGVFSGSNLRIVTLGRSALGLFASGTGGAKLSATNSSISTTVNSANGASAQDVTSELKITGGSITTMGTQTAMTREQFDALVLGLPWQRIGSAGVITVV